MESGVPSDSAAELAGQLRHAFAARELTAYYQPQYEVPSGRVVAVEALCRWRHPEEGLLLPGRFIDIAEQYGMIAEVGRFMLEESGQRLAEWTRRGADVAVSINVSPSELDPAFAEGVLRRMQAFGLPQRAITLEIVESPAITFSRPELYALETLIDGGVGISIDDFGSGHTSLDIVRRLPLTEVKIDKSLVHDPAPAVDRLVAECVAIAVERDLTVVAEGIETAAQYERATSWGVHRAQGYYFSPPLPFDEVETLLVGAA